MTELATAVVSITPTARGRFFWAVWWTGAPSHAPFRKPDASNGGARTEAAALAEAEKVARRHLTLIEPYWARAFNRTLRGEAPPPPPKARPPRPERPASAKPMSAWERLGLERGASTLAIKRAYRQRALEAHPDRGGDAADFRALTLAYEKLLGRAKRR